MKMTSSPPTAAASSAPVPANQPSLWKTRFPAWVLLFGDVSGFLFAWLGAYLTRRALNPLMGPINDWGPYLEPKVLISVVALGLLNCMAFRMYYVRRRLSSINAVGSLLKASYHYLLYLAVMGYFLKHLDLGRAVIALAGLYGFLWLYLSRTFFRVLKQRALAAGRGSIRTLIVGSGPLGRDVEASLRDHPEIGFEIVGFVSHPRDIDPALAGQPPGPDMPILGGATELAQTVAQHDIEDVFLAVPHLSPNDQLALANAVRRPGARVQVVSNLFGVLVQAANVEEIGRFPVVTLRDGRLPWSQTLAKRLFDLATSLLGCLVWMLFFHWWIALWIKLDSQGPVFFSQERVGKDGRRFRLWKYRTMRTDSDPYAVAPFQSDDPRITRAGRWLRKTSLDELPQLWNVLRGDMAMVGPRPEMPFLVERYEAWQRRRLDVKPGLTGLWQVIGRKNLPLHLNMEYDFYYIMNQSLWLDIEILFRTVPAVLKGRGAF
ncbi:MAG: sugar transferase [Sumerlaeia bacterium]